ncbi:hypothetical protein F6U93_03905 [Tamlana haliotis]|uniref:Uncharacterized protein n=1 Tax=Pseudotamlana haliotis TaxID=2614804 RepID=A0A6N6MK60_9FLAO|nr:hypothetical protein [Tamlana haliotis]KAB1069465.1 hypothetical protein F6U93_03905 [Tamlana haliotis]
MSKTTKKLKLHQYSDIYILNKPETFDEVFKDISYSESLVTTSCVECALVFANTKDEFINQMLTLSPRLLDHSVVWVFYPNKMPISEISKLHIEFDWDFLGDYRLKPTKLYTIDKTWNVMKIKKIHV